MQIFLTIISGVLVFVLSQYVLKIWIEPALEFRKSVARLANDLLFHQAAITNNRDEDGKIAALLKEHAARLRSNAYVLPFYGLVRFKFGLPSEERVLSACRELNGMSHNLREGPNSGKSHENVRALAKIGADLRIKVTYS